MEGVFEVNHDSVYRDRLEKYAMPISGFWTFFATSQVAEWISRPASRFEYARIYGYNALARADQTKKCAENVLKDQVEVDSKVWGGQKIVQPISGPEVGTSPMDTEIITALQLVLDKLEALQKRFDLIFPDQPV